MRTSWTIDWISRPVLSPHLARRNAARAVTLVAQRRREREAAADLVTLAAGETLAGPLEAPEGV